ncbi:SDR family oxidoreductase [Cryomorpha ignava]|uniref:SDR family oxidoreductase n=1 Tax=Cryomorpha ignava TaxID=101383 RepID=A0A7K3WQU9_9FLAO|nr:SDR family oxidoreductase [Cryomorpha ignava]NEN23896.1 SDR family oxidoreductase [Cryomorpha ignava]
MKNISKTLIIGAHGKIGQILSKKLAEAGTNKPTAFIRKESQKEVFEKINVPTLVGDLEDSVSNLAKQFKGFDCIVFAAGSGGSTGAEKTLSIDLEGAVRTMEAAEEADVTRYIIVSASHSDDRAFWDKAEGMKPYYIAKHFADETLRNSNLDYTILRPVQLTDDDGTGKIQASLNTDLDEEKISRADVASVIAATINMPSTVHQTIELSSGNVEIQEALESISVSESVM